MSRLIPVSNRLTRYIENPRNSMTSLQIDYI